MKKAFKKAFNKVIRKVTTKSHIVLDVDSKEAFYPVRWELFGINIWSGYISEKKYLDEQSEYLSIS